MPHLIHLRQRIQATETIRKTTNAMRLIAMSTHSRLRNQKTYLENYKATTDQLYSLVTRSRKNNQQSVQIGKKELCVIIGSQKGLCGNFNTALFNFFQQNFSSASKSINIITIGKQITDRLHQAHIEPKAQYDQFNSHNFIAIAHELALEIADQSLYHKVTVLSTKPITFFVQQQMQTLLLPFNHSQFLTDNQPLSASDFLWEQEPELIARYLERLQIKITLEMLLFESLLAEQAARFLAMDSATHNADNMIVDMKRDYNKMRQTAITLELLDFASSFTTSR